jgi:hypothetical protein
MEIAAEPGQQGDSQSSQFGLTDLPLDMIFEIIGNLPDTMRFRLFSLSKGFKAIMSSARYDCHSCPFVVSLSFRVSRRGPFVFIFVIGLGKESNLQKNLRHGCFVSPNSRVTTLASSI